MTEIVIDAIGTPAPVGSKVKMPNGFTIEGGKGGTTRRANQDAWKAALGRAIEDYLRDQPMAPLSGPVSVSGAFRFVLPASDPHRTFHVTAPDLDKLQRLTGDLLKSAGLIRDDALICEWRISKLYARGSVPPGCHLIIRDLSAQETGWREESKAAAVEARNRAKAAS